MFANTLSEWNSDGSFSLLVVVRFHLQQCGFTSHYFEFWEALAEYFSMEDICEYINKITREYK